MKNIKGIIANSSFEILDGRFIYAKVSELPESDDHFMVSKDSNEITVVTEEKKLNDLEIIERNKENYRLITLNVSVQFYSVGFLATVTSAIAKEGMNILVISTYSKDYILVKEENISKTKKVLLNLGFKKVKKAPKKIGI